MHARRGAHSSSRGCWCCACCRQTRYRRSTPAWRNGGGLELDLAPTRSVLPVCLCVAVACRDCEGELQRRQRSLDELAGQRAREDWQARREAWAVRERGQTWRYPQTLGALERERASWSGGGRGESAPASGGARGLHSSARPVGQPRSLSKIDPRRRAAHLGTGERDRKRERGRREGGTCSGTVRLGCGTSKEWMPRATASSSDAREASCAASCLSWSEQYMGAGEHQGRLKRL